MKRLGECRAGHGRGGKHQAKPGMGARFANRVQPELPSPANEGSSPRSPQGGRGHFILKGWRAGPLGLNAKGF